MFTKKLGRTKSSRLSASVNVGQSNNNLGLTFLPENLMVGQINQIGQRYIEDYPEETAFHRNQSTAQELISFRSEDPQEMFIFLANKFEKLHGDCGGEIAQQILALYKSLERGRAKLTAGVFKNGSTLFSKSFFTIPTASRDYMEGYRLMKDIADDMRERTNAYFKLTEYKKLNL